MRICNAYEIEKSWDVRATRMRSHMVFSWFVAAISSPLASERPFVLLHHQP
jgi:hypothetical protein